MDYPAAGNALTLYFVPAANWNGSTTFQFTATDNNGASDVTPATATINVAAVNDPPAATNLSAAETYTEDTPLNLVDIVVSDVDGGSITVTLTLSDPAAGTLNTATAGSVTSTFAGGVWTASGALADVNTLLAGLTFTPAANYNGNLTIATSVSDGVAPALAGTKVVTGTAVNDAPVLGNNSFLVNNGGTLVLTSGNLSATDVDDAAASLVFTVSGVANGQFELLGPRAYRSRASRKRSSSRGRCSSCTTDPASRRRSCSRFPTPARRSTAPTSATLSSTRAAAGDPAAGAARVLASDLGAGFPPTRPRDADRPAVVRSRTSSRTRCSRS